MAFTDAFHRAMVLTAVTALVGAAIAFLFIRSDVLHEGSAADADAERPERPEPVRHHWHCGTAGPPARPSTAAGR